MDFFNRLLGLLLAALPAFALAQTAAMSKSVPTVPVSPNDSMVRTPEVNVPSGQGSVNCAAGDG